MQEILEKLKGDPDIIKFRQEYEIAKEAKRAAQRDEYNAADKLHEAVLDLSGLRGKIVEFTDTRGWGSRKQVVKYRFRVERVINGGMTFSGRLIKKDGTEGNVRKTLNFKDEYSVIDE